MSSQKGTLIYSTTGATTSGAGIYLSVFGVLIGVTLLIVSTFAGKTVGPWWMWLLIVGGFIALGWWSVKTGNTIIELYRVNDQHMHLSIKGSSANVDMTFETWRVANWFTYEYMRAKHGGAILVVYFIVIEGVNKEKIMFKQMIGGKGSEAYGWTYNDNMISESEEGLYHLTDVVGFINAIRRAP